MLDRGGARPWRRAIVARVMFARASLALAAVAFSTTTAAAEPPTDRERAVRLAVLGGAAGLYLASETLWKSDLSPDICRWCEANRLDRGVRNALVWDDRDGARQLSNLTGYALAPLGAAGLMLVASNGRRDGWRTYVDDLIPIAEAALYSQLITSAVKLSVGRSRPDVRFAEGPRDATDEDHLSFFSGHSSLVFSIAFSAGAVAHRRGYKLEPVIWGAGLTLAATTAYLRIAADRHYFTDVMVGSAIGAAGGLLIPRITGSLPDSVSVVPTGRGLAVIGRF